MTDFNNEKTNGDLNKINSETYNAPIDVEDILAVCREYSQLGYNIQGQIEKIMEMGIEEAINSGIVKISVLPLIRDFLKCIATNLFFGLACDQSYAIMMMLDDFEIQHPQLFNGNKN